MQQLTNLKEIETAVNQYGEIVVSKNSKNNVVVMSMEEYKKKMLDEEIEANCDYIENVLKAEQSSNRLREKIRENIRGLKNSPKIYAKIEKTDRVGRDYRRIVIDNYVIIYTIVEEDKTILISHMYYGDRNYLDGGLL